MEELARLMNSSPAFNKYILNADVCYSSKGSSKGCLGCLH